MSTHTKPNTHASAATRSALLTIGNSSYLIAPEQATQALELLGFLLKLEPVDSAYIGHAKGYDGPSSVLVRDMFARGSEVGIRACREPLVTVEQLDELRTQQEKAEKLERAVRSEAATGGGR